MISNFTIYENMVLNTYYEDRFSSGPSIKWPQVLKTAAQYAVDFDVRTPSVYLKAGNLSGGNQQKMVVAREAGTRDQAGHSVTADNAASMSARSNISTAG